MDGSHWGAIRMRREEEGVYFIVDSGSKSTCIILAKILGLVITSYACQKTAICANTANILHLHQQQCS